MRELGACIKSTQISSIMVSSPMRTVKRGLHGSPIMYSCLAWAQSADVLKSPHEKRKSQLDG